jgi:hypothetical protein
MYGMKQRAEIPLGCGAVMVGITYFVDSALLMSVASVAVLVVMYWLKKQGY